MATPLDEIEFLARSEYRGVVLEALVEEPLTRGELREATDASQPTLGRVLDELETRHWIDRDDRRYEIMPAGRIVSKAFTALYETLATEGKFREITPLLPLEVMDFPFTCLADATVITPTRADPSAPINRNLDLLTQATRVRSLSHSFVDQALRVIIERTVEETQTFEGVTTQHAIDGLASADVRAVLTAENGQLYVHREIPPSVGMAIIDRSVTFLVRDEQAVLRALIVTDDETVRTWAEETFERHKHEAEPADQVG
ncbi:ArsR family transcriptional regulator [Natrialba sp. PRR66]|uniref:helix-turn-helix transcriptional regulator n=1 Tax=Natrialba sp. PRR66 TaxID=3098146 RepID=UPI002B1D8215|nr:ArsR family transcriptional regulator [Natrialba sp. PRR66]